MKSAFAIFPEVSYFTPHLPITENEVIYLLCMGLPFTRR